MAQYITTITQGISSLHLCHQGRTVFSSPHYMTGGCVVPSIIFKDGQFLDSRQPRQILNGEELHRRLNTSHITRWQIFVSRLNELALAWSLPFRKSRERHWNPLLG